MKNTVVQFTAFITLILLMRIESLYIKADPLIPDIDVILLINYY